jgi:hypothetical protein
MRPCSARCVTDHRNRAQHEIMPIWPEPELDLALLPWPDWNQPHGRAYHSSIA